MNFPDLLAMSVNNLRRRKLRTALTVLGVIIGTAAIVVTVSLGIGLNELNRELIESYGSLTTIRVHADSHYEGDSNQETKYLTDAVVEQFARIPHVMGVYPLLETYVQMQQGVYQTDVSLVGAPREYLEQISLGEGELPPANSVNMELIYGNAVVQWFYNSKTGKGYWETGEIPEIDFMGKPMFVIFDRNSYYQSQGGDSSESDQTQGDGDGSSENVTVPKKYMLKAAGVVAGGVDDYSDHAYSVYADLELLKAHLKKVFKKNPIPNQPTNKKGKPYSYFVYNSVRVSVDKMEHVLDVQRLLSDQGYQAYSNMEWMEQSKKQTEMIQAVLGGIGAVSLFVAAIGIANTMMMSIYERTKEIGVMKVLGCDMGVIRNMFLLESGFIGFMGGIIGIVLSYGVSFLMNRFLQLEQLMNGMDGDISRIPSWLSLMAIGFGILVGMAAGFLPALRAMKLSPLAAIRNE